MKSVISYVIFVTTCVFLTGYIIFSQYINTRAVESEQMITEAMQTFLDTVTDRGAITKRDYDQLMVSLGATGGTFNVTVIAQRMFAIPNSSPLTPGGSAPIGAPAEFTRDYRPIHGWSTADGSFAELEGPDGAIFFRRHDLLSVTLDQTTFMSHQLNMGRQQNMPQYMRTWNFARGVRNSGNLMVENERPPICFDDIPC